MTASNGTFANPLQYTGRELDPETGLLFYRARYFDPADGRFISEDPIGFAGGENFYRYVKNAPTLSIDPLGLSQQDVQKILDAAQQLEDQMTNSQDRIDPGNLNDIISTIQMWNHDPHRFKGCGEQADYMLTKMTLPGPDGRRVNLNLDDKWILVQEEGLFLDGSRAGHQRIRAVSNNASDPDILIDPWNNRYQTGPKGNSFNNKAPAPQLGKECTYKRGCGKN